MRCLWWYRWTISFLAAYSNCCLIDWSSFLFLLLSFCVQWSTIFSFQPPVVLNKMHWCTGTGSFVCVFLWRIWYCYFLWWFKMKKSAVKRQMQGTIFTHKNKVSFVWIVHVSKCANYLNSKPRIFRRFASNLYMQILIVATNFLIYIYFINKITKSNCSQEL